VLWLIPEKGRVSIFDKAIRNLSATFSAPIFTPHITLGRIPAGREAESELIIQELADTFQPFSFVVKSLECRENPYQKLVITLEHGNIFQSMCDNVDRYFNGAYSKPKDPHISLLYSRVNCGRMADKMKELEQNLPKRIAMSGLAGVELNGRPDSWNMLAQRNFKDS
jgi:2'-5' RNA ligase